MTSTSSSLPTLVEHALSAAKKHGADHADVIITRGQNRSALIRQGNTEGIKHAEGFSLGLRVFKGKKSASVSGNDASSYALSQLAERACAMAHCVPESPFDGLADNPLTIPDQEHLTSLDLYDPTPLPTTETLLHKAHLIEEAALSHDGVNNSNGASVSASQHSIALGTSAGFIGHYQRSSHGAGVSVLAGHGDSMERDYATHSAIHQEDLIEPETLGHEAATKTLSRLNPIRPKTGLYPVLFDPRISDSLMGHLAAAINGSSIARGTSFLKDKRDIRIFPKGITIIDDPTLSRMSGSRPFDAEGCATHPLNLVEDGILRHWLLDSRCARQLNEKANGRAVRSTSGGPHPGTSNLFLQPGKASPAELRNDIKEGILITELMGNALNMLTGDYSRGASGFMIRDGHIAEPISGITVAGNLHDMFSRIEVANDLFLSRGHHAPTIRINKMSIAGQ